MREEMDKDAALLFLTVNRIYFPDEKSMAWHQWPKDIPRPDITEYANAVKRYMDEPIDPRDQSDWCMGLQYVMSTSHIDCWKLFFKKLYNLPDTLWENKC